MIKPDRIPPLDHDAAFHGLPESHRFTVGEFWRWAFSGLLQNDLRGILAEFLVAKALGIELDVRATWDDYDLVMPDGTKIEVKSGGYLQAWEMKQLSRIVFSRLSGQRQQGSAYDGLADFRADVYIFCVQTAQTHDLFDPLNVEQWLFWVMPRLILKQRGYRSIALSEVRRIAGDGVPYTELAGRVHAVARQNLTLEKAVPCPA